MYCPPVAIDWSVMHIKSLKMTACPFNLLYVCLASRYIQDNLEDQDLTIDQVDSHDRLSLFLDADAVRRDQANNC
jgi:hypothetical protein